MSEIVYSLESVFKKDVLLYKKNIPRWIVNNSNKIFENVFKHKKGDIINFIEVVKAVDKNKNPIEGKNEIIQYLTKYLTGHKGMLTIKNLSLENQELLEVFSRNNVKYMLDNEEYPKDAVKRCFVRNFRTSCKDMRISNKPYPKQ